MTEFDVEKWTAEDDIAAARQGWSIFTCHGSENGDFQVQCFDDPEEWAKSYGFTPPELEGDVQAVAAMQAAFERGEPHAVKAWEFLREASPLEFAAFGMKDWKR